MTINFRGAASGNSLASPMTVTVPAGVQPGDTVVLFTSIGDPGAATWGISTAGATTPVLTDQERGPSTSWALWQFAARAGDAGKVITVSANLAPIVGILLAYSGAAPLAAADLKSFSSPAALTAVSPVVVPSVPGSWGLAFGGNNSGGAVAYSSGTFRQVDGFAVSAAYDSAGPVTSTGGGTWSNNVSDVWWGYTAALRPAAPGGAASLAVFAAAVI